MSTVPAQALTFNVYESTNNGAIGSWIAGLGGHVTVKEDFEGIAVDGTMDWYKALNTGVGTFTAGGLKGTGDTSYNANNNPDSNDPYFSIQDRAGDWFGRKNTTAGGSQWLDTGDISKLTLTNVDSSLTNLFFYIQDPSDVGATTKIGTTVDSQEYSFAGKPNGGSYFVGITLGLNETLSQISWTATTAGDGFGLDDFSTVSPVPEPATMFLFGTGIAGLAGLYRRKIS